MALLAQIIIVCPHGGVELTILFFATFPRFICLCGKVLKIKLSICRTEREFIFFIYTTEGELFIIHMHDTYKLLINTSLCL